jgi:hypothetical protein
MVAAENDGVTSSLGPRFSGPFQQNGPLCLSKMLSSMGVPVTRDSDRDRSIDRMLRRTLAARDAAETSSACLDAETIAAWVEGALSPREAASVEAHAAGCTRCQAMLAAMAKTTPPPVAPERSWRRRVMPFLVPLTAATALVIWLAMPRDELRRAEVEPYTAASPNAALDRVLPEVGPESATPLEQQRERRRLSQTQAAKRDEVRKETDTANLAPQAPPAAAAPSPAPPPQVADERASVPAPPQRVEERASAATPPPLPRAEERVSPTPLPQRAAARASEAPPVADQRAQLAITSVAESVMASPEFEIRSPDPRRRWRVIGGRVERSTNGGSAWVVQNAGSTAELTAGASPAPDVCWLAGRAGTVLLSTDGRSWRRVPFPEAVDLVTIVSPDVATATVVTADGRSFTTKNAGLTWDPAPLQEFPAAPF